jgi:predicted MPP superfamily phosphohydrolase
MTSSRRRIVQIIAVLCAVVLITGGAHYFIYTRVFAPLAGEPNDILAACLTFLWLNMFFGFGLLRILHDLPRRVYEAALFFWMGFALFLLMASVPVFLIGTIVSFEFSPAQSAWSILGLAGLLTAVSFFKAQREVVITTELPLLRQSQRVAQATPPAPDEPAREVSIAVISDVHVSGLLGARRLRRIVKAVNRQEPDLIFVVGDLVDGSVKQLGRDVLVLEGLKAKLSKGVFFVTGNHEYFSGAESWKSFLRANTSWEILENERRELVCNGYRLVVAGIEDRQSLYGPNMLGPRAEDSRLPQALAGLDASAAEESFVILLAHQPKDAQLLQPGTPVGLQVSGHTHAGQIWPFSFVVKKDQGYLSGLFDLPTGQKLYVSQGTCYWGLPFRLGTSCEISLLRLQLA